LSLETIRRAPKVLLHDHLDGGVRPQTVVDLARECGYDGLPTLDADELGTWFIADEPDSDLVRYLAGFAHTTAVMQTRDALERVAYECALDLARDGVVYAEVRFAPELHTEKGLNLDEIVLAVLAGFERGSVDAAREGHPIVVRALLSAMRQAARSQEIAALAVRHRDQGVAGFDVAGPEKGFPPTQHLDAFQLVQRENFHVTLHAGEAFGLPSIWEALQWCNAERLGHGVRIVDDITQSMTRAASPMGRLANLVRDRRVPLELCPTSNVHTGAAASIAEHPIELLKRLRFRITVNTDNRLMSGITLSVGSPSAPTPSVGPSMTWSGSL
jgi:adenosine deaminase